MMHRLLPYFPFAGDETPLSFAVRLAAFHTRGRLLGFLNDIGIPITDLFGSKPEAMARLAELSGVPLDVLLRTALTSVGTRRLVLRGEMFTTEFLTGGRTLFCPLCLAADDALGSNPRAQRRHRLAWRLRPFRVCPEHGLHLIERRARTWLDKAHELCVVVPEHGDDLQRLAEVCAQSPEPSPLQTYLAERLDGRTGPAWLDGQGIEQATLATELLGAVIAFGPKVGLGSLAPEDWTTAARAGFAITCGGEEDVGGALQALVRHASAQAGPLTPARAFGTLYTRLNLKDSTKDPGPIKALVREAILTTMTVEEGEMILGERLAQRRLHTVASRARAHDMDTRTLRNRLVADGVLPKDHPAFCDLAFLAAAGARLAARAKAAMPVAALGQHLGCTRPQAQQIVAAGLLRPLVEDPSDLKAILRCSVLRSDLEALLTALHARVPEVPSVPTAVVTIAKAAEKSRLTSAEILQRPFDGNFPGAVRAAGAAGVKAIRIPVAELPVPVAREPEGVGITAFCQAPWPEPCRRCATACASDGRASGAAASRLSLRHATPASSRGRCGRIHVRLHLALTALPRDRPAPPGAEARPVGSRDRALDRSTRPRVHAVPADRHPTQPLHLF